MTCCAAALSDNRRTLILVSDRKIGFEMISTDPDTEKVRQVHQYWWLMYSGNDITPVFPISDRIEASLLDLSGGQAAVDAGKAVAPDVLDVEAAVAAAVQTQLRMEVEAVHLATHGWTMDSFHKEIPNLPPKLVTEIFGSMSQARFDITLIVAGFDRLGQGHILTIDGQTMSPKRHANPLARRRRQARCVCAARSLHVWQVLRSARAGAWQQTEQRPAARPSARRRRISNAWALGSSTLRLTLVV